MRNAPLWPALACCVRAVQTGLTRPWLDYPSRRPGLNSLGPACPSSSSPNGTPGKKPPAPSVKLRLSRTPLEGRSGSKPLAPSAQRGAKQQREGRHRNSVPHECGGIGAGVTCAPRGRDARAHCTTIGSVIRSLLSEHRVNARRLTKN